jgi:alpha-beta hydrolase superfamily lysophospholipase
VEEGVSIGCRFYPAKKEAPTILFFHGNGETACDYDYVAPLFNDIGLNLFVADYRGYGYSTGSPTATNLVKDSHPLFQGFVKFLEELAYARDVFLMGRSMGSVPALEIGAHYQQQIHGIIIESGFASTMNLIAHLGFSGLFSGRGDLEGFGNAKKIESIAIPLLVIHGENDRLIPLSEGEDLHRLAGSEAKKLVVVPRADHNDLMMVGRNLYFKEIQQFVRSITG